MYEMDPRTKLQIDKSFTYHPPNGSQGERYVSLRAQAKALAEAYATLAPASRELSLALTKLEESVMWVNAAIARNE